MITACMASTGGQKIACAPISGGQTGIVGAAAKKIGCFAPEIFRPHSFLQLRSTPVHALITSRLDYCNGLLVELRRCYIRQRLQRIQNNAARLILVRSEPAFSHAVPLLHSLHCLPVAGRIKYKLCVLMFDVFHGTAPVYYLTDLCSRCTDHRLRSSVRGNFLVRRTRTRFTDSLFTVAGPAAWNSLPAHIRMIDSHPAFCRHKKLSAHCS